MRAWLLMFAITGCATTSELGLLQHGPGDGTGGSLTGHWNAGAVTDRVLAVGVDVRGDLASSGDRLALGGSVLAGLPVGRYKALARAGLWHAVLSDTAERSVVPSFELAGYVPFNDSRDPAHPERGFSTAGVVFGVREDLDHVAYTTVFVGIAVFLQPTY